MIYDELELIPTI